MLFTGPVLFFLLEFHVSLKMKKSAVALCTTAEQSRSTSMPGKNLGVLLCSSVARINEEDSDLLIDIPDLIA